jgi:hypothetical protein
MPAQTRVTFRRDQHMLNKGREMITADWTAIRRGLAIGGRPHRPPRRARKPRHVPIVAPALLAAVGLGVTAALMRLERDRRTTLARQHVEPRFMLLARERLPAALKRMALEQLDFAIELLSQPESRISQVDVHEIRKAIKRLRA